MLHRQVQIQVLHTVDEQGGVIGVAAGKVKITATSADGNGVKGVAWVYVTLLPINI